MTAKKYILPGLAAFVLSFSPFALAQIRSEPGEKFCAGSHLVTGRGDYIYVSGQGPNRADAGPEHSTAKSGRLSITFNRFSKRQVPEPYATVVYVDIFTGLRVSELAGLRWNDIGANSITIDERFCRGDWGGPKSASSNATMAVNRSVIESIYALKSLIVAVKAGGAVRKYRVVKSDADQTI